jgi:hypothetical protein
MSHPDFAVLTVSWELALRAGGYADKTVRSYQNAVRSLAGWLAEHHRKVGPAELERQHIRGWLVIVFAENAFEPRDELPDETFDEGAVARATQGRSPRPRLLSPHGTDVSTLTLTELDLGACVLQGAYNLDKLRIVGSPPFADTPTGWKRGYFGGQAIPMWRWTRRQTLIEEHHWRASRPLPAAPNGRPHPQRVGWSGVNAEPPGWVADRTGQRLQPLPPGRIALLYRALRKAQEDSRIEPGAADLYYGEMEMRRLALETLGVSGRS